MKLKGGAYGEKGRRRGGGGGGVMGLMPAAKNMTGAVDSHCARRNPGGLFLRTLVGYTKLMGKKNRGHEEYSAIAIA